MEVFEKGWQMSEAQKPAQWTREKQTGKVWCRSVGAAKWAGRQDQVSRVPKEWLERCSV